MENQILELCKKFNIQGEYLDYQVFKSGHINTTVMVRFENEGKIKEYVLQKINKNVFKNPEEVMDNISSVTNFIKNKLKSRGEKTSRKVLKFYQNTDGKYFIVDDEGDYWRMYRFVNKSITFNETDNLVVLEETGKAFGEFQQLLDGYPINDLNIIIPHFHNTANRFEIFKDTLERDPVGRAQYVKDEINQYLALQNIAIQMYMMQKAGKLQLRVTHNDTKCNNVLFDEETGKYLCVIDLDTIMPGLVGFDFGDAVRFAANTCSEDETDLDRVKLDVEKFDALAKGFISRAGSSLTEQEKETLSLGAITMTVECGLRFLTDYIDGDNYFKIDYPLHNLDRARCQLKLAQDMVKNYSVMQDIVKQYCEIYSIQQ